MGFEELPKDEPKEIELTVEEKEKEYQKIWDSQNPVKEIEFAETVLAKLDSIQNKMIFLENELLVLKITEQKILGRLKEMMEEIKRRTP